MRGTARANRTLISPASPASASVLYFDVEPRRVGENGILRTGVEGQPCLCLTASPDALDLCMPVICRYQAFAEVRGDRLAPQYTCEHIWWTTHGLHSSLARPGRGVGIVRGWVMKVGEKGGPKNTAGASTCRRPAIARHRDPRRRTERERGTRVIDGRDGGVLTPE